MKCSIIDEDYREYNYKNILYSKNQSKLGVIFCKLIFIDYTNCRSHNLTVLGI